MRSKDEIRQAAKAAIEARKDEIIEVGRHIWKNPEPGYREVKTSEFLVDKLTKLGLKVKTGLGLTGFRADIDTGRPGPTVAVLGELDSLIIPSHPECDKQTGAVHSCGHNASATALVGTAIGLMREAYSNTDKIRIHGIISNGGDAVNVIPDTVTMEYMLRVPSVKEIVALNARFDHIVMHAAHAAECTATIESVNGFMPLFDDNAFGELDKEVAQYLVPGSDYDANSFFMTSCTDMGDVATVIPAIHGYVPGAGGTSHSDNYYIADEYSAYVVNSALNALLAVELLYGDAEKGRAIAARKKDLMSSEEYIKLIDSLNQTIESTEVLGIRG